jgi:hypothetical protein
MTLAAPATRARSRARLPLGSEDTFECWQADAGSVVLAPMARDWGVRGAA